MAIKSLRLLSVAKVFAFYYSLWGFVTGLLFAFTAKERWEAPLGFFVPFLSAKLDFVFKRSEGALGLVAQIVLITLAYALTGWMSGLFGGIAYNLISRYFGFQLVGSLETRAISEPHYNITP